MRLLVFADLHLDTHFQWAEPRAADRRRQALRDTLSAIVDLAQQLGVEALLCAGDLYEQDGFHPDTAGVLSSTFERLHPIRVLIAAGNHDWLGPTSIYRQHRWSPNVTIFQAGALQPVTLDDGLTLWGASHDRPAGTGGLLEGFRPDRGGLHLALFHGSEEGGYAFAAQGKAPHAPFTRQQIQEVGLCHAFVGHYHTAIDADLFTYPGNPDPLTFGETDDPGGPRGAVLADVAPDGIITRERHRVAQSQVHDVVIDITGCGDGQEVRARITHELHGLRGWVRATLQGDVSPDLDLRLLRLQDVAPQLDALAVRTDGVSPAYDWDALARESTVRGQFVRDVRDSDLPQEERQRVLVTGLRALSGRRDLEV